MFIQSLAKLLLVHNLCNERVFKNTFDKICIKQKNKKNYQQRYEEELLHLRLLTKVEFSHSGNLSLPLTFFSYQKWTPESPKFHIELLNHETWFLQIIQIQEAASSQLSRSIFALQQNGKNFTKNISIFIGINHMQPSSSINKSILILRLCFIWDGSRFAAVSNSKKGKEKLSNHANILPTHSKVLKGSLSWNPAKREL